MVSRSTRSESRPRIRPGRAGNILPPAEQPLFLRPALARGSTCARSKRERPSEPLQHWYIMARMLYLLFSFRTSDGGIKSGRNQDQVRVELQGDGQENLEPVLDDSMNSFWKSHFQECVDVLRVPISHHVQGDVRVEASSLSLADVVKVGFPQIGPPKSVLIPEL